MSQKHLVVLRPYHNSQQISVTKLHLVPLHLIAEKSSASVCEGLCVRATE